LKRVFYTSYVLILGPGFVLTFNDVPAIIEPFLKGEIDVEARIFDGTGAEIICIHTLLEFE